MQLTVGEISRVFDLQIRCENCMRESERRIAVPDIDDAPDSVDELIESNFLANLRFCCPRCESAIGRLVGAWRRRG
ncbi:hypothetical protein ATY76_13360 [Rhizobium sp. R339]|uniref:hypothetical protein n=1 Tax=Rhizobium sp. R339 TaxID=1764273 RepID=UPI000B52C6E1|nr:hypothetical protein [Rhizobium sp. R339]OWV67912.1 hypothetical protein ATY76_13360 [Rhizobium sp. R339]